jgi:hypothetical protein
LHFNGHVLIYIINVKHYLYEHVYIIFLSGRFYLLEHFQLNWKTFLDTDVLTWGGERECLSPSQKIIVENYMQRSQTIYALHLSDQFTFV